jgi:hypothetical protein
LVAATIIREDPVGNVSPKQLVFGVPVEVDNSLLLVDHSLHIVVHTVHSSGYDVQWLRQCATNQKVAGSIPDGVIGIFHQHNPSSCTMALGDRKSVV